MSLVALPWSGSLGAGLCCRTVMHVTVFAIHRARAESGSTSGGHPTDRVAGDEAFPGAVCNANPTPRAREVCVEIVVTGRNVEIPDHFREHIADKVARLERYDHKIVALEVELFHERNRRQLKSCQRVEITGRGGLGVARAEACAQDFYAALDAAVAKLEARMRRSHDRRRVTGRRTRVVAARGNGVAVLEETVLEETESENQPRSPPRVTTPSTCLRRTPARPRGRAQGPHIRSDEPRRRAVAHGAAGARLLPVRRRRERPARASSTARRATTTG